ncbi:arsenate reductase (glutaredoxin) [Sulfurimonas diazotrophicus]|uniref:Arsenate reductase (Glutaredoxin) n=1 Tax=Sulfurimonas diazotrophicus TaxID=3131939 RepID=A0ABZ3H9P7_9BACT
MRSKVTIWHNPRCGKSREALKLLEGEGITPEIIRYLDDTPSEKELRSVLKMLGIGARDLMRTKEAVYKELGLKEVTDEDALIKAMTENPKLIERPVVITDGKAVIGRPPEKVVDLVKA